MVRRLVEHEEVRAGRDHERQREPAPLAAGERRDGLLVRLPAGEEEAAEQVLRLGPRQPGRALCAVEHAAALVELDLVLGEVRRDHAVAETHASSRRFVPVEHGLEQRRLARAVRADEADVLSALERERDVREQVLVASRYGEGFDLQHRAAAARRPEEVETQRLAAARQQLELAGGGTPLLLEPLDLGELGLRLLGLALLVAEALHEALEPDDVRADALGRLRRRLRTRRLLAPPDVPRPRKEERAAGLQLEDAGRDGLQEPAVVGDEDDRRVERLQLLLEPLEVLDVEVVRRLVEEQQVGIAGQGACERGARQLSAGERRELPIEVVLGETEAAERRRRPIAPVVAARVLETRLGSCVPTERRLGVVAVRHRLLERAQLLLGLDQVAGAGERVLAQGQAAVERRPLVVQGDSRALGEGELAAVDLALADEHPQQRRLAGPVRAGEREPLAPVDGERDALEEQRAGELLAQVGSGDDHGLEAISVPGADLRRS